LEVFEDEVFEKRRDNRQKREKRHVFENFSLSRRKKLLFE